LRPPPRRSRATGADRQVDALALDLGRLGNGAFDFAERGVVGAEPASRAFAFHERVADRRADASRFEHDAAGVELVLHVQNGGLDLVELEPFAQHVDQIELAAKDTPGAPARNHF
jgi:hypothetical protein